MTTGSILQYATLLSLLIGGVGVAVAVINHRAQVKTEIFLALSARYDEWMQGSATFFWSSTSAETMLPDRSNDLTISALRLCALVSLGYYLFREHRIPKRMWLLLLRAAERRMRSPLFVREWDYLKAEFESFPEFVALVTSVQHEGGSER
ncbi:MAG TPA: hypothetical protein VHZ55_23220 [Bryobacteraceae bacterium]|jgi:hypothetical protein|nr:hypothetical protein [Bryobacteraceae bacterium]